MTRFFSLLTPIFGSLAAGSILIWATGKNPFTTWGHLFQSGFSCRAIPGQCSLLTALQFSTPLIFSGLSAAVALRAGFFSLGQAGQMLFGAAAASLIGGHLTQAGLFQPAAALAGAALFGALWGLLPALLKVATGVNEIIVTLLLNPIALVVVDLFQPGRIQNTARLLPFFPGSKLTPALLLGIASAAAVYFILRQTTQGFELRNSAQAPRFADYAGIDRHRALLAAMLLSGALAGLAGAVEVLGVQYRFVTTFSAVSDFDGLIVAFAGQLHPFGVLLLSFLLGGLRAGAIVGLQIRSGIPRELGGALIAVLLIFAAMRRNYRVNRKSRNL